MNKSIISKPCKKCSISKPMSDYHKHKIRPDGHADVCKSCACSHARQWRKDNITKARLYDNRRGNRQSQKYQDDWSRNNPEKHKAHWMVHNRIKSGSMKKQPCEKCGSNDNIHAHHDDYSKPLDVRWLCAKHHCQLHATVP